MKLIKLDRSILHSKIFLTCVFCIISLILIASLTVYPTQKKKSQLNRKIALLKSKIEKQKALYPLYTKLLQAKKNKKEYSLPTNRLKHININKAEDISPFFTRLAQDTKMGLISTTPVLESLNTQINTITVKTTLQGKLLHFREFLLRLLSYTCVQGIDYLNINSYKGENNKYQLQVLLKLNKSNIKTSYY